MPSDSIYDAGLSSSLADIREQGLFRSPPIIEQREGTRIVVNHRPLINFCSNDYLGLAQHPQIKQAMAEAAQRYGTGSSASPLICGKTTLHQQLEQKIAKLTGRDRALLFNCGFMANLAAVSALVGGGKLEIFLDRLCHASILDGVLASGVRFQRYPHVDMAGLKNRLDKPVDSTRLVITESIFSMDGDIAPLDEISRLCRRSDTLLYIDDAHGLGVLGKSGRGALEHFMLGQDEAPLVMGTFGKALGVHGAFVAGKEAYIDLLIQRARPYIYSTSMPAPVAAAALKALEVLNAEQHRRAHLHELIDHYNTGLAAKGFEAGTSTPIQPLIIGSAQKTMEICECLQDQGVFVMGIRPPTVARGESRLRITLSASHSVEEVDHLINCLDACRDKLDF
ncbi:MAG: 8-amino-7-oxononanoate synthase [Gammaproteobacteria bacterium]|nr:8-amino-7-oxononanoate synthase [Gammaproteobacteria bacterium]